MQQSEVTAQLAANFNSNYCHLTKWQDTLEFLCFTLYYIVFEERRWPCYQAAELSKCARQLRKACCDQSGKLYPLINDEQRRLLKSNLSGICQLRNAVAHKLPQSESDMRNKKTLVEGTITQLENLIRVSAATYNIRSMPWHPVTCAMANSFPEQNSRIMTVQLDGPSILSARRRSLECFTAKATALRSSEEQRQEDHRERRNRRENERLEQDAENHEIDRHRTQLELCKIARDKRFRREEKHIRNAIATRDRQLEQIKKAKKQEEFALKQLTSNSSRGNDRTSVIFTITIMVLTASLILYL